MMGMQLEQYIKVKCLVMLLFLLKELKVFEFDIECVVVEIIDDVVDRGLCEFVFDIVLKFFVYIFCKILGVLDECCDEVYKFGNVIVDIENCCGVDDELLVFEFFVIV